MKQTCLVTGGAGFIGSHLCDALLENGYAVVAVDNLITGKEANLESAKAHEDFRFMRADVIKPLEMKGDIDYVFHLASPASVVDYQLHEEETALVNSEGTRQMVMMAKAKGSRFLFTSTSEVYGDPLQHPQKETYWGNVNPNGVRACYDESKRFGEMMTMLYVRRDNVDGRIVRIFNTYGPRMRKDDGRVISNFINQALENKNITVYGDGTQTRSFCYVDDMVAGIMKVMFAENGKGEVFNLGNPQEYTMEEIATKIKEKTQTESSITHEDLPQDDPQRRRPDISKAKTTLGWEPRVTLEEGLEKTIEYYRSAAY